MTDTNSINSSSRTSSASAPSAPIDAERLKQALSIGLKTLKDSGSKAAAARAIYDLIHMESRDVILQAFIDGATVTVKGHPPITTPSPANSDGRTPQFLRSSSFL